MIKCHSKMEIEYNSNDIQPCRLNICVCIKLAPLNPTKCRTYIYVYIHMKCLDSKNKKKRDSTLASIRPLEHEIDTNFQHLSNWILRITNEFEFINYSTFYPTFILCAYLHGLHWFMVCSLELGFARFQRISFLFFSSLYPAQVTDEMEKTIKNRVRQAHQKKAIYDSFKWKKKIRFTYSCGKKIQEA